MAAELARRYGWLQITAQTTTVGFGWKEAGTWNIRAAPIPRLLQEIDAFALVHGSEVPISFFVVREGRPLEAVEMVSSATLPDQTHFTASGAGWMLRQILQDETFFVAIVKTRDPATGELLTLTADDVEAAGEGDPD